MKHNKILLILLGILMIPTLIFGQQVYEPEGVNLPGEWNAWENTNDPDEMGNFRMVKRDFAGGQYITTINVDASGADTSAGTYAWLFTSGPDGNEFNNKWANASPVNVDGFNSMIYQGGTDNSISLQNGYYYTVIITDNGYADSEAAVLKTSASPVDFISVSGVPTTEVPEYDPVTISVELDQPKSPEEKIYLRYSTDNFTTSYSIEITDFSSGTTGTAQIPGQPKNAAVEFYVLSTTIDQSEWDGKVDLATLRFENNNGSNYIYHYEADVFPLNGANNVQRAPRISWYPVDNLSGYDLQLDNNNDFSSPIVNETDLADTSYTLSTPLDIYTRYFWRFKPDTANTWSSTFNFRTESEITFGNVQFPESHMMDEGNDLTIYGQLYVPGITEDEAQSTDISAWIGISTINENPSNWMESSWKTAEYNASSTTAGDNDEYAGTLGSGLEPGTYYYAYRYKYKTQNYVYGTIGGFWADTNQTLGELVIKDIPALSSPEDGISGVELTPALSWIAADASVQGFSLQVSESSAFETKIVNEAALPAAANNYDIASGILDYETTYYWRVRSDYDTTSSGWSSVRSFTTLPPAPEKVNLLLPVDGAVGASLTPDFEWDERINATGYELVISTDQSFADGMQAVIEESSLSTNTYSVDEGNSLSKETEYFWRVRAVNATGSSPWSDVYSFVTVGDPPSKVTLLSPENESTGISIMPTFEWEQQASAAAYQLQISSSTESFDSTAHLVLDKPDLSQNTYSLLQFDELENAKSYYWRVRSSNNAGESDWSDTLKFTTSAPVPVLVSPEDQSTSTPVNPVLSWGNIESAQYYDVQIATDEIFTQIASEATALSDTSFIPEELSFDSTYHWRVRVQLNDIESEWSEPFTFTVKANPPAFPQLVSPDSGAVNVSLEPNLVWEAPANAVSYEIQVSKSMAFDSGFVLDTTGYENTDYLLSGLENGTSYYWRVRAFNSEGTAGQWSLPGEFKTLPLLPETVTLLTPADSTSDAGIPVHFTWSISSLASHYDFQYSENPDFTFKADTSVTSAELLLEALDSGAKYYWRVRAANGAGNSAWTHSRSIETGVGGFPGPLLTAPNDEEDGMGTALELSWSAVRGADYYQVQVSAFQNFDIVEIDTSNVKTTTLDLSELKKETGYFWRVRAHDAKGSTAWSSVRSFTTQSQVPGIVKVNLPADSSADVELPVRLSWNPGEGVNHYQVRLSEQRNFSIAIDSSNISDTTLTLSGLDFDTEYYWQVRAINDAGSGPWTEVHYFSTIVPIPEVPELVNPEKGSETDFPVRFGWNEVVYAQNYDLQVSTRDDFDSLTVDSSGIEQVVAEISGLKDGSTYYWRVRAVNRAGAGSWSAMHDFKTVTLTSVERDVLPDEFALHQNYPNPFNPVTNIQYDLKTAGDVGIRVYDISGRLIQTLVNERKTAGRYRVVFDAGNLASGIYMIRMEAGPFLEVKKMTLIK